MKGHEPLIDVTFSGGNAKSVINSSALIDTGAQITCIPKEYVAKLCLLSTGSFNVSTSISEYIPIHTYSIDITINKKVYSNHTVVAVNSKIPLIGWDILQKDFFNLALESVVIEQLINIVGYIRPLKERSILILGQDTSQIERLRIIQNILNERGYKGIIVKDQSDIEIQSVEEKINMLGSISKFVICENSFPSGHIDELKICSLNRYVTAIIQEEGKGATWMQSDYPLDYSFIKVFKYSSLSQIDDILSEVIKWAELKLEERRKYFNNLYHWRNGDMSSA